MVKKIRKSPAHACAATRKGAIVAHGDLCLEAERLLEDKSRELFDQKQQLEKLNSTLESRVSAGTLKLQRSNAMLMTLHEVVLMAAEV
mgnify:CR=1 FL=1